MLIWMFMTIFLFFDDDMIKILKKYLVSTVGGTFDVLPLPYYQLYTISFIKYHHNLPTVYAILKRKVKRYIAKFLVLLRDWSEILTLN